MSDYGFDNFLFVDVSQPLIQHVVTKRGGLVLLLFSLKSFKLISNYLISKIICLEKKPRFLTAYLQFFQSVEMLKNDAMQRG